MVQSRAAHFFVAGSFFGQSHSKAIVQDTAAMLQKNSYQSMTGMPTSLLQQQKVEQVHQLLETYKELAEKIVAKSVAAPPVDFIAPVLTQLESIKTDLVDIDQPVHQKLVDDVDATVAQCNTEAVTALSGVQTEATEVDGKRSDHAACRSTLDSKISIETSTCLTFDDQIKDCASEEWVANHGETLFNNGKACHQGRQAVLTQDGECDTKQREFEAAYCAYADSLLKTCSDLATCRSAATANREAKYGEVRTLVASHKAIYESCDKASCYLRVIQSAANTNVTSSDVAACKDLDVDTSRLDVAYGVLVEKADCDVTPVSHGQPGETTWRDEEYESVTKSHLEGTSSCPTVLTQAPTTPAPTLADETGYHFAPIGSMTCDYGQPVSQDECGKAGYAVFDFLAGFTTDRRTEIGMRVEHLPGSPPGCISQNWYPRWNTHPTGSDGAYYGAQLICTGSTKRGFHFGKYSSPTCDYGVRVTKDQCQDATNAIRAAAGLHPLTMGISNCGGGLCPSGCVYVRSTHDKLYWNPGEGHNQKYSQVVCTGD